MRRLAGWPVFAFFAPALAWAHHPGGSDAAFAWNFEPWVVVSLFASLSLYVRGVRRLWARAGRGRGISPREAGFFVAGWGVLAVALVSPVDTLGSELFSAHMVQHELMMVVAAPLFVLARPLEAWAWGLPASWATGVARFARWRVVEATWRALTEPVGAWIFHAAALWLWHVPVFFEAAARHEGLHALQHATFLASALCFWWSVLVPRGRPGGAALASAFTTMLHTGALGALLTFGPRSWYPIYEGSVRFGLTVIEDQQLGGLVMWVPGGAGYLMACMAIAGGLLRETNVSGALR